ncbi:MAG: prepilin-type N-terminal cleavage/methylation domain-containing protein [Patescibacteria group bacterium]|jgi:type II secretion system protein G
MSQMKFNSLGFTLIELLVVISIIGFLSTLGVVNLKNAREKARDTTRLSDLKQLKNAMEMYFNDNRQYPPSAQTGIIGIGGTIDASLRPYLQKTPIDPLGSSDTPANSVHFYYYDGDVNCTGGEYARIAVIYSKVMERISGNASKICTTFTGLDGGGNANSYYILAGPYTN